MYNHKKAEKIRRDPTKHYPNKNEAHTLRKIMSFSGLSEEEVRQNPKYRKMLSEAQKIGVERKINRNTKWVRNQIKQACKKTRLAPQHPKTIEVLEEILQRNYLWGHFPWSLGRISAKTAVKEFSR